LHRARPAIVPTVVSSTRWRGLSVAIGSASKAESGPRWVRVATVAHGQQRSPTVANGSDEPQVIAPPAQAAGCCTRGDSDCGPEGRIGDVGAADGQQPVSLTIGGARPRTVEDHDRRSCHRRPLTWRFSRVFPGPQHTTYPCRNARYRSRTEEARGSNPLTSTPNTAGQSVASVEPAALAACCGRTTAARASHSPAQEACSDQATRP
jgi:hypothetical protein